MNNISKKLSILALCVATVLTGCDKTPDSSTTTPEESSSSTQVKTTDMEITLGRKIYLVGEEKLDVVSVTQYREALNGYQTVKSYTYNFDSSKPGNVAVEFYAGTNKDTVEVEVYATAEDAAKAHELNMSDVKEFNLATYVDVNKKQCKAATYQEKAGDLTSFKSYYNRKRVDTSDTLPTNLDPSNSDGWNASVLMSFTELADASEDKFRTSVYDATKYIVPHLKNGSTVDTSASHSWFDQGFEMYFDAEGRIAWMQQVNATNLIAPDAESGYYSNSAYYSSALNPVFAYGDDYDPTDEVKKTHFEKVIPTGGFALVSKQRGSIATGMDLVWKHLSGTDYSVVASNASNILTNENRKEMVDSSRAFYDTATKYVSIYRKSSNEQIFAYYYVEVLNGETADAAKWKEAKDYSAKVIEALQIEKALVSNPEVQKEKVLKEYYEGITKNTLGDWVKLINTTKAK